MAGEGTDCYSLSQVLRKEFESVRPSELGPILAGPSSAITENDRRRELYRLALGELRLSALALSGGGIRSACVALGVIQSLAEAGLLRQFDYLSTVSGGGYIGSWLSAWLYWNKKTGKTPEEKKADNVIKALTDRSSNPDAEPPPIRHLRAYSSYLTPKLGLTSADTWAAVTQVVRNLVLNWLILVPAICLVVLAVKIVASLLHTAVLVSSPIATVLAVVLVLVFAGWSLGYKLLRLYGPAPAGSDANAKKEQSRFLRLSVLPALAAGICFAWLANKRFAPAGVVPRSWPDPTAWPAPAQALAAAALAVLVLVVVVGVLRVAGRARSNWFVVFGWLLGALLAAAAILLGVFSPADAWPAPLAAALAVVAFGVMAGVRFAGRLRLARLDLLGWGLAAAVAGAAAWLGLHLYGLFCPPAPLCAVATRAQLVLVVFGMPWLLLSMLMGQLAYVLARSYSPKGDFEREWLARAGGWFIIAALAWITVSGLVLFGSYVIAGVLGRAFEKRGCRAWRIGRAFRDRHRAFRQERQHAGARAGDQPDRQNCERRAGDRRPPVCGDSIDLPVGLA